MTQPTYDLPTTAACTAGSCSEPRLYTEPSPSLATSCNGSPARSCSAAQDSTRRSVASATGSVSCASWVRSRSARSSTWAGARRPRQLLHVRVLALHSALKATPPNHFSGGVHHALGDVDGSHALRFPVRRQVRIEALPPDGELDVRQHGGEPWQILTEAPA